MSFIDKYFVSIWSNYVLMNRKKPERHGIQLNTQSVIFRFGKKIFCGFIYRRRLAEPFDQRNRMNCFWTRPFKNVINY